MKKYKVVISVLIILAFALSLTACGGGAKTTTQAPAAPQVKKVVMGVASEEKPLSYTENGKLVGYEVDALRMIDELIPDYEFEYQAIPVDAQVVGLDSGKYVLIAEGLTKTDERVAKYFIPDTNVGTTLITIGHRGDDKSINKMEDLVGKKLTPIAPSGAIYNLVVKFNKEHKEQITINTQEGIPAADRYKGVASGKYDAIILPALMLNDLEDKLKLGIKQTEPVIVYNTYFVMRKDQAELGKKIDEALKTIKKDGRLSQLAIKYFGQDILKYEQK